MFVAWLLVAPAVVFVGANLLEHGLGVAGPSDALRGFTEPTGVVEGIVTALVLLGPTVALAVALWPVVRVRFGRGGGEVSMAVAVRLRWSNLVVAAVALGLWAVLAAYLVAENAECWFGAAFTC